MLFSMLYEAVFVQVDTVLTDREAEGTKKAVRDGLNMVMEKSVLFHPPFIGSLQVLGMKYIKVVLWAIPSYCWVCLGHTL